MELSNIAAILKHFGVRILTGLFILIISLFLLYIIMTITIIKTIVFIALLIVSLYIIGFIIWD